MPLDIWALGVTAYILSYNKFPFNSDNDAVLSLYDNIHNLNYTIPEKPKRSPYFLNFIQRCLEKDPNKRITSEKIFYLKWINMGEKEHLKNQIERVAKIVPKKEEIYQNIFSMKELEKLKDDKRPVINKIANQIMEKAKIHGNKNIKIKIKIKNKKKEENKKEEDKK